MTGLLQKKCIPCEGNVPPLTEDEEDRLLKEVPWEINREGVHKLQRTYEFPSFMEAIDFVKKVADIAEEDNHHPNIHIYFRKVELELYTHAIGGLSENDFIVAAKVENI